MKRFLPQQQGFILLLTLIEGVVFFTILSSVIGLAFANYHFTRTAVYRVSALAAAEAGADAAVFNLNLAYNSGGPDYKGTTPPSSNVCGLATSATSSPSAVTFKNDTAHGKVTYETCIVDTSPGGANPLLERTIYSVGKVYQPASAAHPIGVQRVKLVVEAQVSGTYSVHTGNGGLNLSNSATITNGNVYVNGGINMTNTSQIGSVGAPLSVYAANYLCPKTSPFTGYPALCATGEPISIGNSAAIYGDVHANGQTTTSGMSNTGLVQTTGVSTLPLPTYDRDSQKAAVTTLISGDQSCSSSSTVTYQANTKIAGSLTVGNNCSIILKGNLWITGNLVLNQKAFVKPDTTVTTMPTVMIDGSGGLNFSQQSGSAANNNGIGTQFITFYSAATCSPDCPSLTGSDLVNSTALTTITLNNQSLSAGSRFYAYWSGLSIGQGGAIGSVAGQRIDLNNSGSISFASTQGSNTYSWVVRFYDNLPVPDARATN